MTTRSIRQSPFQKENLLLFLPAALCLAFVLPGWLNWAPWQLALPVMAAWLPYLTAKGLLITRRSRWLALFFFFVITQSTHGLEHMAQMIQIHLLGVPAPAANGIFGVFNIEWVHCLFNTWILLLVLLLLFPFRSNGWLLLLCLVAIWHEAEHLAIMQTYLHTHLQGTPGLLARGGLLWGGLPLTRPDLHFLYVSIEEVLLLAAYLFQSRRMNKHDAFPFVSTPLSW